MGWFSPYLLRKLILVSLSLQWTLGFDILDYNKRQSMIPVVRMGRAALLTIVDNKGKGGGMMPFPRLGRRITDVTQALIPYPRIGRVVIDSDSLDYDNLINTDYSPSNLEESLTDALSDQVVLQKRPNVKLIPRIGRKKRSVSEESGKQEDKSSEDSYQDMPSTDNRSFWEEAENKRAVFIPRVGRTSYISAVTRSGPPRLRFRNRVGFIPRVGRRSQ